MLARENCCPSVVLFHIGVRCGENNLAIDWCNPGLLFCFCIRVIVCGKLIRVKCPPFVVPSQFFLVSRSKGKEIVVVIGIMNKFGFGLFPSFFVCETIKVVILLVLLVEKCVPVVF